MFSGNEDLLSYLFSRIWKYCLVIFITVLITSNCGGCKHNEVVKVNINNTDKVTIDSLKQVVKTKINSIEKLLVDVIKLDSINKNQKPIYAKAKYITRDFIIKNPCDSLGILMSFDSTISKADAIIKRDSLQIDKLKQINANFFSILDNKNLMLQVKDNQLQAKDIDLGIETKKTKVEKRKKIKAIVIGVLSVIATVLILK